MLNKLNSSRYVPFLTLLLIGAPQVCAARQDDNTARNIVVGLAAATGITAIGVGLWSYFCSQTPEEVLHEAQRLASVTRNKYEFNSICELEIHQITPAHLHEDMLYRYENLGIQSKCLYIASDISALTHVIEKATHAITKAERYETEISLKDCLKELRSLKTELLFLQDVVTLHKPYFELFQLTARLFADYQKELTILEPATADIFPVVVYGSMSFKEKMNACVHLRQFRYPYFAYAQLVIGDISRLKSSLSQASYKYPRLTAQAEHLLQDLTSLYHFAVNEPEYQRDKYAHEQAEREQERLRLERMRLLMEQQRLAAEQARLREERRRREEDRQQREYERQRERERHTPHVEIVITRETTTTSNNHTTSSVCNLCGHKDCYCSTSSQARSSVCNLCGHTDCCC